MARHFVSKKEAKSLKESLMEIGIIFPDLPVEIDERKGEKCYFVDGKPFVYVGRNVIPTLFLLNEIGSDSMNVTVDDGAVPHIINGANVFAQGIIEMDQKIKEKSMVFIRNRKNQYVGVGMSTRSYDDIMTNRKGEAIILVHFPGDKIMKTFYS
ncbi:MAG: DUF1947 domain-containing protein [Candidatus Thermoplasmatota archaeon]|jgi:PUA domain protein|nr:DUF1947 domain-containing protein [Candidatus Thermoplasmatota archaeon]MDA8144201.1 DUF1947 domain-containing protein [Thermoplasmatales archaeon]